MEYPGLLNWANSVRQTMANDPGRQLFKDQVQIHGFSFLDDYLDNIISGQRQDPLIELVKTPGRKKAALKKPNHLQHVSQRDLLPIPTTPVEAFLKTNDVPSIEVPTTPVVPPIEVPTRLVEAFSQTDEVPPIEVPTTPVETISQTEEVPPIEVPTTLVEVFSQTDEVLPIEVPTTPVEAFSQTDEVPPIEVPTTPVDTFSQSDEVPPIEVPTTPVDTFSQTDDVPRIEVPTTPVETFSQTDEVPPIEVPTTPVETFSQTDEASPLEVPTAPSSQILYDRDHVLTDIQEEDVEMSVKLIDKPIPPPSFPTLPEPIPLRKSTKPPRDPSINAVLSGAATPGAPVGGMRTSWLMKAREANLDKLSKKSHPSGMGSEVGANSSLSIQGTKRKSDDLSLPQERPPKFAKTSESEGEMESQSQPPAIVESAPEGVFDRLKKVVEDLGIRVDRKVEERKQPEVMKVLQMAAVAAKKQQEEADKKAARLKEMESRRQLAIQRKADEEKAKVLEEERKMKEDAERRKKEREPTIKYTVKKKEDDTMKKRKIEMEKKQEIKKPSSSVLIGKAHLKSVLKSSSSTNPSHFYGSSSQPDPSALVQSQTVARVKVQIDAPKPVKHAIPSEDIELPEINSEYSDSEDEDRVRTFNPPEWAQSPELRQALKMQSTMNPDDIFGAVRPLKMEEIFKSRTSRFRARTSSANWTGTDRLTMQEQGEYARRMGFK